MNRSVIAVSLLGAAVFGMFHHLAYPIEVTATLAIASIEAGLFLAILAANMDDALSPNKRAREAVAEPASFSSKRRKQGRWQPYKSSPIYSKTKEVPEEKLEQKAEYRRQTLEHYLTGLRALSEPDEMLGEAEDFLENFKPQNREEEMLVDALHNQITVIKEKKENGN